MFAIILGLLISTAVWAESDCPICGMLFDEKTELITHLIAKHPVRDKKGQLRKPGPRDHNPELAIIISGPLLYPKFFSDYSWRKREVWSFPEYAGYTLDFSHRRIVLEGLDFGDSKSFENFGSALLLLAVAGGNSAAIKVLLQHPENLANLDVVDKNGKNAFYACR